MNPMNWLIRMSRWSRNPPSMKRVLLVFGIVAVALIIFGIEMLGYWPEWATMDNKQMRRTLP